MLYDPECSTLPYQGKFATVVMDPPWPTRGGSYRNSPTGKQAAPSYYKSDDGIMSLMDIACMPIPQILEDDAFVFVWVTTPHLPDAFKLIRGWGLGYMFTMAWVKVHGPQTQNYPMYTTEYIVVGRRGKPKFLTTKAFKTAYDWRRGEHSAKPEEFYELLRRVSPEPRIDVFNRRYIAGFWGWGNESPYPVFGADGLPINKEEVNW